MLCCVVLYWVALCGLLCGDLCCVVLEWIAMSWMAMRCVEVGFGCVILNCAD